MTHAAPPLAALVTRLRRAKAEADEASAASRRHNSWRTAGRARTALACLRTARAALRARLAAVTVTALDDAALDWVAATVDVGNPDCHDPAYLRDLAALAARHHSGGQ
jgi:hypothetical protein